MIFDDIQDLLHNLGIGSTRLKQLTDSFISTLMSEIFKQLKKSDDASTAVLKVPTRQSRQGDDAGATDAGTRLDGDEADKKPSTVHHDEDDEPSD